MIFSTRDRLETEYANRRLVEAADCWWHEPTATWRQRGTERVVTLEMVREYTLAEIRDHLGITVH